MLDAPKNGIKKSFRGVITLATMAVFLSLVHSVVHFPLSDQAVGLIGAALLAASQWVDRSLRFYFPKQSKDEEGPVDSK